jgi:hypothetical protein
MRLKVETCVVQIRVGLTLDNYKKVDKTIMTDQEGATLNKWTPAASSSSFMLLKYTGTGYSAFD